MELAILVNQEPQVPPAATQDEPPVTHLNPRCCTLLDWIGSIYVQKIERLLRATQCGLMSFVFLLADHGPGP